jgi:hypothetical protein
MKNKMSFLLLLCISTILSSCYKENEIIPALVDSKGQIANISVFWVGATRGSATAQPATTITVAPSAAVVCNVEYISEAVVKEFRLYTRPGTTGTFTLISTTSLSAAGVKYDTKLRNQVATFSVPAPATKGATMQVAAEIVTTNDLLSVQRTVTIKTTP